MKKVVCCVSLIAFLMATMPMTLHSEEQQASVRLRNLRSYSITEKQLELLKAGEGMVFYTELPETLPKGQIAVVVPEQLGGGYLTGSAGDIAAAFNGAGITVGLRAEAVSGFTAKVSGIAASTLLGIVIAAATGTSKPLLSQGYGQAEAKTELMKVEEMADSSDEEEKDKKTKKLMHPMDEDDAAAAHSHAHYHYQVWGELP